MMQFTLIADILTLDILFSSNHNIHKSSLGLCFGASGRLIERFYYNLSIKGFEAQIAYIKVHQLSSCGLL